MNELFFNILYFVTPFILRLISFAYKKFINVLNEKKHKEKSIKFLIKEIIIVVSDVMIIFQIYVTEFNKNDDFKTNNFLIILTK